MTRSGATTTEPTGPPRKSRGSQQDQAGTPTFQLADVSVLGAAAATYFGALSLAGALLVLSTLKRRSRNRSGPKLCPRPAAAGTSAMLDMLFAASVAASLTGGGLQESPARALFWLPVALAPLGAVITWARRADQATDATPQAARLLLGIGLLLAPVAVTLYSINKGYWTLVCCFTWFAVHLLSVGRKVLVFFDAKGVVQQTRLVLHGKGSALRNAVAAAVATGLDFSVFSVLVALHTLSPAIATFIAAATGGLVNFLLNKRWTFSASGSTRTMLRRYVTVSGTSALLNATVVGILLWLPLPDATLAWVIARGLVFLSWNFPLQRDYVFSHRDGSVAQYLER